MTTVAEINPGSIQLTHGQGEPQHAIIWLHGLGASANDFPGIVPELGLAAHRPIRFIFAQAPNRAVTINGGMRMPAWYDIKGLDITDKHDRVGMTESYATVQALIQSQIDLGIPSDHIIIAGFSQGAAVSYYTAVRTEHKLAGVLALSTYLPFAEQSQAEQNPVNLSTPFFASHGTQDPVVPIQFGQASVEAMRALNYQVKWQTYAMQHNVVAEQISDIGDWINTVYGQQP